MIVNCRPCILLLLLCLTAIETFQLGPRIRPKKMNHRLKVSADKVSTFVADNKVLSSNSDLNEGWIRTFTNMHKVDNQAQTTAKFYQKGSLNVPRGHNFAALVLESENVSANEGDLQHVILMAISWYLDCGGRIGKLYVASSPNLEVILRSIGFDIVSTIPAGEFQDMIATVNPDKQKVILKPNPPKILEYLTSKLKVTDSLASKSEQYLLNNIVGRLLHDSGNPASSIQYYTQALLSNGNSSATFRNMGSAYQATGNMQMAFASFQQAIQLQPDDALVYLKLAYFYDDFARKDWIDAEVHAEKCYRYYLNQVDPEDTSVLIRLGNLLLKNNLPGKALIEYNRALQLDNHLEAAWFNLAHAQLKMQEFSGAKSSLLEVLQINPQNLEAKHMFQALNDAESVRKLDSSYVIKLFNDYADEYDDHGKKMLYCAPRLVRQELAKVYKSEKISRGQSIISAVPTPSASQVDGNCASYVSFMNSSLDILDLGCGTGQAGAWVKDYAKTLVGVDMSPKMIEVAKKKMLYQNLHTESIENYLTSTRETYDLVVATDVFSYIGDLSELFSKVSRVVRANGVIAFTVENLDEKIENYANGFRLMPSGRFSYSKSYLDAAVKNDLGSNFDILLSKKFSPRVEDGEPTPGYLYIVQKNNSF